MRKLFRQIFVATLFFYTIAGYFFPVALWSLLITGPIIGVGVYDYFQKKHSVRRNFPILGHFRYLFEAIRPEINQYFVESNTDGAPFNREQRSLVYQRAKKALDTLPFGTQRNVYETGYEWVNHSLLPVHVDPQNLRVLIGGPDCKQPYLASVFNISAMSFGALSPTAIEALNRGAQMGGFYHNTGEGGISPYHLKHGGDLVWQIGTGYFGCRTSDGKFSEEHFEKNATRSQVKMIEIKLSQGAKPGHGGILPAQKITPEIAEIRGVELGKDVISPPGHKAFQTPKELCLFVKKLRDLSGGKPVGLKMCLGERSEFIAFCKAMIETKIFPDYISVDGSEGGTGAAPVEFSNSVGMPLKEGLTFIHNALVGFNLRDKVKVMASGKSITGIDVLKNLAIGADISNTARGMMLALGCIQALRCNSNHCPVGVATQDKELYAGLDIFDKGVRIFNYHKETVKAVAELMGAMGVSNAKDLKPSMVYRRVSASDVKTYEELYSYLKPGELLENSPQLPQPWKSFQEQVSSSSFKNQMKAA